MNSVCLSPYRIQEESTSSRASCDCNKDAGIKCVCAAALCCSRCSSSCWLGWSRICSQRALSRAGAKLLCRFLLLGLKLLLIGLGGLPALPAKCSRNMHCQFQHVQDRDMPAHCTHQAIWSNASDAGSCDHPRLGTLALHLVQALTKAISSARSLPLSRPVRMSLYRCFRAEQATTASSFLHELTHGCTQYS